MDITFSVFNSRYNPYNSPTAYVPHSAINLSVKPGEGSAGPTITATDLPTENPAGPTSNVVASYLDNSQDFSSATNSATVEVNRASVAPSGSVQANSSPQILDLTRGTGCAIPAIAATGSLIGALGGGGTAVSSSASVVNSSFNVAPSSIVPIVSTKNASSVEASTVGSAVINSPSSSSSKREQTEPMDFSSGQGMTFTNRNFDTSTFNRGASPGDLSRFRSSSKSNPHVISQNVPDKSSIAFHRSPQKFYEGRSFFRHFRWNEIHLFSLTFLELARCYMLGANFLMKTYMLT